MTDNLNTESILVLGTGNIRAATAKWLDNDPSLTVYSKGDHGWFIAVPTSNGEWRDLAQEGIPADLYGLLLLADATHHEWLMLDQDETDHRLPVWEW